MAGHTATGQQRATESLGKLTTEAGLEEGHKGFTGLIKGQILTRLLKVAWGKILADVSPPKTRN